MVGGIRDSAIAGDLIGIEGIGGLCRARRSSSLAIQWDGAASLLYGFALLGMPRRSQNKSAALPRHVLDAAARHHGLILEAPVIDDFGTPDLAETSRSG